jgi:5'-3' exonuclease
MEAIGKEFSAEGFERFSSGFVMGMLSAPLNSLHAAFGTGYNKIFKKEEYEKYKAARETAGTDFVKHMSSIPIDEFFNNKVFEYGSQSDAYETRMGGTEKDARDASDAAFVFKMTSVMQNNMTDFYKEQLQDLTELNAAEIEEVIPSIPKGEGQKYLDKLPSVIEKIGKFIISK